MSADTNPFVITIASAPSAGAMYVKDPLTEQWVASVPYVKSGVSWVPVEAYVRDGGVWVKVN